jgi:hypothetical protein
MTPRLRALGGIALNAVCLAFALSAGAAFSANTTRAVWCLGGLESALAIGGFSGSLDCRDDQISVKEVGVLSIGGHSYSVYDYRYRLAPTPGGAVHGGQRVLVIDDHRRYVGQYALTLLHSLSVQKQSIIVEPAGQGGQISFLPEGPPEKAYVDGEVLHLFR